VRKKILHEVRELSRMRQKKKKTDSNRRERNVKGVGIGRKRREARVGRSASKRKGEKGR